MRGLNVFAAAVLAISTMVAIQPVRADDADDAQAVIEDQINAFLEDDAETAYSHAAPVIKRMYPDSDGFFEMVRRGYQPVYRPDNFAFGRSKPLADDRIVQEVLISGPDGDDWTAVYVLDRQPDGIFKISGVQMVKSAAPEI